MLKKCIFAVISLTIILLGACTGSSGTRESAGEFIDSAAITTKVKASLVDALGTQGFSIQVKTFKDKVQLSGFVANSLIKTKAGQIAAGVEGVRMVQNSLIPKT